MLNVVLSCCLLATPEILGAEARTNGVLVTLSEPVTDAWMNGAPWQVGGQTITHMERSPDDRRLFLRTLTPPAASCTVARQGGPHTVLAIKAPATRSGPDYAAASTPTEARLDRAAPKGALCLFVNGDISNLVMKNAPESPLTWTVQGDALHVTKGTGDVVSRTPLGSGHYHIEWRSPAGGDAKSQNNGNSGVKLASRYEVQIMNNAGAPWPARHNEAGSIYRIKAADQNVSLGPDRWQSYDIWYTEPVWHDGAKIADARMTVYWNGVKVHNDVLVPAKTGWSIEEGPEPMPLLLQDHHHIGTGDVCFRNVWFQPSPAKPQP
jgi:hypothetical protein